MYEIPPCALRNHNISVSNLEPLRLSLLKELIYPSLGENFRTNFSHFEVIFALKKLTRIAVLFFHVYSRKVAMDFCAN